MPQRIFYNLDELEADVGKVIGYSEPIFLTQEMFNEFARLTGADHWSHVDTERSASSPFGGTIAPGMLVLSLGTPMLRRLYELRSFRTAMHYGFGKVRFTSPVPVDSWVHIEATLLDVTRSERGARVRLKVTYHAQRNTDTAVCAVAETISQYLL